MKQPLLNHSISKQPENKISQKTDFLLQSKESIPLAKVKQLLAKNGVQQPDQDVLQKLLYQLKREKQ